MAENNPPNTPRKRLHTGDTFGSPSSTKKWTTPAKGQGKASDIEGYVLLVGPITRSQNNNPYFDIIIQRASNDTTRIRLMDESVKPEIFKDMDTNSTLHFKSVMFSSDFYFFSKKSGSSYSISPDPLSFPPKIYNDFCTTLTNVEKHVNPEMHVQCLLKYVGGIKSNPTNGSLYRNVVFYDAITQLFGTIWNPNYFHLDESVPFYITNLKHKDYFGIVLYSTMKTIIEPSNMDLAASLPDEILKSFILRASNTQNPAQKTGECLLGAAFQSYRKCPSKTCPGTINDPAQGNRGVCNTCPKRVNVLMVPKELKGEIDVDEETTLHVDKDCIDATFGSGVADAYINTPDEIADKFLELTNVSVLYDNRSKKAILVEQQH